MTIREAAKEWKVKEQTVLNYILEGYIYGLSIENNEIVIPNIPKPHIKRKPKTVAEQDNYILTAMNKEEYVNAKIMGIDQDKFAKRLEALIKSKKIFPKNDNSVDYFSNLDFVLSFKDDKNIVIAPSIDIMPTIEIKVADQIGVVNGKVG